MEAWPSMLCTERISAPFLNRSVANEWRRVWGETFFTMPARRQYFFRRRWMDRTVRPWASLLPPGPEFVEGFFLYPCDSISFSTVFPTAVWLTNSALLLSLRLARYCFMAPAASADKNTILS